MSHTPETNQAEPESLRTQLVELNNRSRAYTAQLWQLPLAYLAAAALVVAGVKESALPVGLLSVGLAGLLVLWHLVAIDDGRRRSVRHLQRLEQELSLTQTAEDRPGYFLPLHLMVLLGSLVPIGAAIVLWCKK